jgi:hypothetical protein
MSCKFPQEAVTTWRKHEIPKWKRYLRHFRKLRVTRVITYNQKSCTCLNRTPKECTATIVAVSLKLTSSPKPNETSACRQRTPEKTATLLFRIRSIFALFLYLFAIYPSICILLNSTIRALINKAAWWKVYERKRP